jgi:polyhydroxybutyrate depolymerase
VADRAKLMAGLRSPRRRKTVSPMSRLGWALATVAFGAAIPPAFARSSRPLLPFAPGTHKVLVDQRVSGVRRSYYVHVPPGHSGAEPLPVILALHGAFSTARKFETESGLSRLADREGFLVVYPQGIGLGDLFRHWNSGHCCGKARKLNLDDVGFALAAVDDVARRNPVDRSRLYVVGHSNGGMLAYRIAAERPELIAAVAVASATIGGTPTADEPEWTVPRPKRPVPVLAFHGRADENVPYDGGRASQSRGESSTISVARSVGLWVEADGCDRAPQIAMTHGGRVERRSWSGCGDGSEVVLYSLEGWGHDWPQQDPFPGFDAAEIAWKFFQSHRRAP